MKKLKKSNFLEGAFIATFCIIVTKILGVIYVIPFYDIIGEQGGTLYGYAYNIYNIFLIISSAGIPMAISKLTSEYNSLNLEDKKTRMYQLASKFIMIFSTISFLICFIFAPQLSNLLIGTLEGGNKLEDVVYVIRLISFALLVIPLLSIKRGYLQGHRYILEPSISQILEQVVRIAIILIGSYLFVYIFKLPIKYAVGISVFAACIGGIATYIYLSIVTRKNKKQLGLEKKEIKNKVYDKEIIKKIITYSLPFIVINLANSIYTFTDMVLIIRHLPKLGYSAIDTEFITSVFTTWGVKFVTILTSISTGLVISLIPNMVKDFTEKNIDKVNQNYNKCLKIIMLIVTPLAIFISVMSKSVWGVFYGVNKYGPMIIRYSIIVTIADCLYTILNSILQSFNERKMVYISVITGIILNIVLDVPFMYLFDSLKLPAYYGAITASLTGVLVSNIMSIIFLRKKMNLNHQEIIKTLPKFIVSIIILIISLNIFNKILNIETSKRMIQLLNVGISGIICGSIYLIINFNSIKTILPKKILDKLHIKN